MTQTAKVGLAAFVALVATGCQGLRANRAREAGGPTPQSEGRQTFLQLVLLPPAQLVPDTYDVRGLRMGLLFTRNRNLCGVDLGPSVNLAERVRGAQIVGLASWTKADAAGLQLVGGICGVEGPFTGIQMAGLMSGAADVAGAQVAVGSSIAAGDMAGLQIGLIGCGTTGDVTGVQIGGQGSMAESVVGVQTGLGCLAGDVTGLQLGGLAVGGKLRGFQIAALFSGSRRTSGAQIAGLATFASDDVTGVQTSLAFNWVAAQATGRGRVVGGQVAGVLNRAEALKGFQFGLVNYCGRLSGIQLGLINVSREHWLPLVPLINIRFRGPASR